MRDRIKVAAVQMYPRLMRNEDNLKSVIARARTAAASKAELVVFPECALPGYIFASRAEALPYAETIPGPATEKLAGVCLELGIHTVVGLLEKDGDRLFNAAVLVGPEGLIGKCRKMHLPFLGIDRFVDPGDLPFRVWPTPAGNIGLLICYDVSFPESCRSLALLGADIIALPTNWPAGRGKIPRFVIPTRAFENRVYLVAADRVGEDRSAKFLGMSKIVDTMGDTLAEADGESEEIIYAEVSLSEARRKRQVMVPGEFEIDMIHDRRPDMYGLLTKPVSRIQ